MRRLSRQERRGALLLSALIFAVIAASIAVRDCGRHYETDVTPRVIFTSSADSLSSQEVKDSDVDDSDSDGRRVGKKTGKKRRHHSSRKRRKKSQHSREKASAAEPARDFLRDTITVSKSGER